MNNRRADGPLPSAFSLYQILTFIKWFLNISWLYIINVVHWQLFDDEAYFHLFKGEDHDENF